MADDRTKRYYWLRLHRDFFKRHDVRIIENMENGKDYLLFYLKLLCESVDHEGDLRFSETIPYDASMLATITDTNIDVVRSAVKLFVELDLMQQLDDGTMHMQQVANMTGSVTNWADKKRVYREKQKALPERTKSGHVRQELEIELEIEKELESKSAEVREADEVVVAYRKAIEQHLPALSWPDTGKQYAALKDMANRTRELAPSSAIPEPVEFARAVVAAFVAMKQSGKSDYWRKASVEPVMILRRFGECVTALMDRHAKREQSQRGEAAMDEMERIREEVRRGTAH